MSRRDTLIVVLIVVGAAVLVASVIAKAVGL